MSGDHSVNGSKFSTHDRNDEAKIAQKFKGGWWWGYRGSFSRLNGVYSTDPNAPYKEPIGVVWWYWIGNEYALKSSTMTIMSKKF